MLRWFTKVTSSIHDGLEESFGKIGGLIYRHTILTIILTVLIASISSLGMINLKVESESTNIWVPQDTYSMELQDEYNSIWDETAEFLVAIIKPQKGTDVLNKDTLTEALFIHNITLELTDSSGNQLSDVCYHIFSLVTNQMECYVNGLDWWFFDEDFILLDDGNYHSTVSGFDDSNDYVSIFGYPHGKTNNVLGSIEYDSDGAILSAGSLKLTYLTQTAEDAQTFQRSWIEMMKTTSNSLNHSSVAFFTWISIDDELSRAVMGDVFTFGAAFVGMSLYVFLALSSIGSLKADSHEGGSKLLLSLSGTGSVALSIVTAFGLCSALRVPLGLLFTPITQILPFILMGIGIDDTFVMVDALQCAPTNLPPERRVSMALARAGTAISVTSFTNASAFFLGSLASIPAIRSFCIYAGLGVLFDYFYQVTFFCAFMAIDARRVKANRIECLPCIKLKKGTSEKLAKGTVEEPTFKWRQIGIQKTMRVVLDKVWSPIITHPICNMFVLVIFTTVTCLAVFGALNIESGLPMADLAPDDSYLIEYYDVVEEQFGGWNAEPFHVVLDAVGSGFDFSNAEKQGLMAKMVDSIENYHDVESCSGWQRGFYTWMYSMNLSSELETVTIHGESVNVVSSAYFYPRLGQFFLDPWNSMAWGDDVIWDNTTGTNLINSSRIQCHTPGLTSPERVALLKEMRQIEEDYPDGGNIWGSEFVFLEYDLIQMREMLINLGLALLAVSSVTLLLLVHPLVTFFVALCIALIDIWLFGMMYLLSIKFNSISIVNLVMSIGLSFDYIGHIGHGYVDNRLLNRKEKVRAGISKLGNSVVNGAISTFLGVLLLSTADSALFRIFFKMFCGIVLFGFLFALVFLPTLLSLFGPTRTLAPLTDLPKLSNSDQESVDLPELQK